ncbi:glycosyltransferase involved in cell wall biosynthesis [Flavobacterium nitrogenifigens]|uniref:Glycosyltransferase involved in cell wall biosynthesis n=2 Tax=Flavobacterium TaxID=237 RepID=A0A7W7IZY5_9FLAO|nr:MULTISPECIES: glycosyltransferase [Flavobacterium]MBB4803633.1 glycosyltransferase involved in cell wall biosynthesis [Flavobacterium nitrogenifigens]MBB6388562.1 glycosyltransferase involved in cell wall biosynthesis [Flavobacterium notoginsengisoli]
MKFAVITHVNHILQANDYFGYAPYVNEMNIWFKYVDEVIIVAPIKNGVPTAIESAYKHEKIDFRKVPDFSFTSFSRIFSSIFKLPIIFWKVYFAMKNADHIHLRCPGNMGLVGCFVQVLFPNKTKTAKYAGNWDSQSKQPFTYNIQKWILNNTFLTRNMEVLVYGNWKNQTKNIKPFFTATYSESEKEIIVKESLNSEINFVFVGSLVSGKNPLYAIKLVEKLARNGKSVILNLYGEGAEKESLKNYIQENNLQNFVILHGNKNKEVIKKAYQQSHFVILPSKSEGWPKAIAEAMFWGCVPIATKISCVPFMLDFGNRGILLEMDLNRDIDEIESIIFHENNLKNKSILAQSWSQNYTLELFETEIKKLLLK